MRKGFTLIELIVVIAIIAILAAIIAPNAFKAIEKAKVARAISDYKTIKTAVGAHYADTGKWIGYMDWLIIESSLFYNEYPRKGSGNPLAGWDGPYLEGGFERHPWGGFYFFECEEDWAKSPTEPPNGLKELLIDFEDRCDMAMINNSCYVAKNSALKIDEMLDDGNLSTGSFRGGGGGDTRWVLMWDLYP